MAQAIMMRSTIMQVRRGDIYTADLSPAVGSEQGGIRPVLIIQNDMGNRHSPTVICAPITSTFATAKLPTHIEVRLNRNSVILLEQIRTIDKGRLKSKIHFIDAIAMREVNSAIVVSLGLEV